MQIANNRTDSKPRTQIEMCSTQNALDENVFQFAGKIKKQQRQQKKGNYAERRDVCLAERENLVI
jgi:hypothetical protein